MKNFGYKIDEILEKKILIINYLKYTFLNILILILLLAIIIPNIIKNIYIFLELFLLLYINKQLFNQPNFTYVIFLIKNLDFNNFKFDI